MSGRVSGPEIPQVEDPRLDNKSEQILESLECRIELLSESRLLRVAHIVVEHPGKLPEMQISLTIRLMIITL